jgi:endonuclease/exonuclease/phosphatase family metal-dependent hydrolase
MSIFNEIKEFKIDPFKYKGLVYMGDFNKNNENGPWLLIQGDLISVRFYKTTDIQKYIGE